MSESQPAVRTVADTARWVAYFRARETERDDALFRDPYAARLAGKQGFQIASELTDGKKHEWAWVTRTYLFDRFIAEELALGADLMLSLAAGLDTRPYRMKVKEDVEWIEVDFPEVLAYKQEVLGGEGPSCRLERVPLDLLDLPSRREFFAAMNERARKIVVITEGLLLYLNSEEVASLARDLSGQANFRSWVIDLVSPGQLRLLQGAMGRQLAESGAGFKFAPEEGIDFFVQHGWRATGVEGLLKNAAVLNRAPAELLGLLPEPQGSFRRYPWTGVCLLKRI